MAVDGTTFQLVAIVSCTEDPANTSKSNHFVTAGTLPSEFVDPELSSNHVYLRDDGTVWKDGSNEWVQFLP